MTTSTSPDGWPAPAPPEVAPPRRIPCGFRVIVGTREQLPYDFSTLWDGPAGRSNLIDVPVVRLGLPVADYAIEGHPGFILERKSKADLYGSISQARENFESRLRRMHDEFDSPWVLVEAEWYELLTAPPQHSKFSPKSLTRTILAWMVRFHRVRWLMAPTRDHAEAFCFRLMDRYVKESADIDHACRGAPVRPGDFAAAAAENVRGDPPAGATATGEGGDANPAAPGPTPSRPRRSAPPRKPADDAPILLDAL